MPYEIKMPPLSQTTDEVRLLKWLVKAGDRVNKGDALCEVENDKSTMPLESVASGNVLELCVPEGASVLSGSVIAILGEKGEVPAARPEKKNRSPLEAEKAGGPPASPLVARKAPERGGVPISHIARNVAEKRGIDLTKVRGTGPGGRIVIKDLDAAEAAMKAAPAAGAEERPQPAGGSPAAIPFSSLQAAVARNLVKSKTEIPHFYLTMEIQVDRLLEWIASVHRATGSKPSFYSPLVFAASRALRRLPRVNASARQDGAVILPDVNVGIAVAVGEDLYVPVVRSADRMGLDEINGSVKWLIAKAQNGKLEPGDQSAGTITISNLGVYPVDEFSAIINPPQASILAVGGKRKVLRVADDDSISIREVIKVTGSFDHRIVNGALAAQFLTAFKNVIEKELV